MLLPGAGTSALLKDVRVKPELLIEDPERELRTFRLALSAPMGTKRAQGRGSFVASVLDLLDTFYGLVVQNLKPWTAAAPKLRYPDIAEIVEPEVPAALLSTAISSQDETEMLPASVDGVQHNGQATDEEPQRPTEARMQPASASSYTSG